VVEPGSTLTLDVEKPAAGGRMLARHHGQIVLVWGAIPGERVSARVERVGKGVVYADTIDVLTPSADRRLVAGDWRCGGNVLAFVEYPRQLQLKGQIIHDALARIGRVPLADVPAVIGSPEQGYRMRARLHAVNGRVGFYREGTHALCSAAQTQQLAEGTIAWIDTIDQAVSRDALSALAAVELSESIDGGQRACHLELHAGADPMAFTPLVNGLVGLSVGRADRQNVEVLAGAPVITDIVHGVRFQRDVRAFFQGNRFLVVRLLEHVMSLVGSGPLLDLYAGVGLFGLSAAAAGAPRVIAVEGDPVSGADLTVNAEPFGARVRVERRSVEQFVALVRDRKEDLTAATVIVDPPRTGMTKEALAGAISLRPTRVVYVSCDVATLARDTRTLIDAGYELQQVTGIDLFPNTAHVESVALFTR
jgi:tRNA/tmRNA/rRNA uracil-C5-methylase (TrmA/RlmC/RlmD family)